MKVICIKEGEWSGKPIDINPINGSIYTVVGCEMVKGCPAYKLKEIPFRQRDMDNWWDVINFVPLDNFKQEEIEKELSNIFELKKLTKTI
jgi:hypothetical protein